MTKKELRLRIILITCLYFSGIIIGIIINWFDNKNYILFKDLIPLIIAIPIGYLGFCFQRRISYLQALRQLWTNLIISVNAAIQYTHQTVTTQKEYGETLLLLCKSIDEVRGVYKNLEEKHDGIGLYPFESLKCIFDVTSKLGFGTLDKIKLNEGRKEISHYWRKLRKSFLLEFDRSKPSNFDTPFV